MAFQLPKADELQKIIRNSRPATPLDLSEVTDSEGQTLTEDEAQAQINSILGDAGPLPAMSFPLFEELVVGVEALETARIHNVVRDGKVAGQLIEVRMYGLESPDRYKAMANLKATLKPWMAILSHPVFNLGKASLSDRLDKELKGRAGRAKGASYAQLAWSFNFVVHSELYEYAQAQQSQGQSQDESQSQGQPQGQDQGNIEL